MIGHPVAWPEWEDLLADAADQELQECWPWVAGETPMLDACVDVSPAIPPGGRLAVLLPVETAGRSRTRERDLEPVASVCVRP